MVENSENKRLKSLFQILASERGNSYFEALVVNLYKIIPMKYAFIGVLTEDKRSIRTIALSVNGIIQENLLYELKHTPCENVVAGKACWHFDGVQKKFPLDLLLVEMKINSYLGFPLNDAYGHPIGIMVFLNETNLYPEFEKDQPFLDIIQILVGSELSRHLSEVKLKEREENFRITLDSIGDAVMVTSPHNIITFMNRAAEELTGCTFSECRNKSIQDILKITSENNNHKINGPITDILLQKRSVNFNEKLVLVDKLNRKKIITYSGSPIYDDTKNIIGDVFVFRDVTKEHEMEIQFRHTQKMEAIGQLAGGIAHDFNNILTGIIGCANILQRKSNDSKIVETYSAHIINSAKRTSDLTRKLLDFSRKGKLLSTELDLHHIINETLQLLDHSLYKGIEIKTIFKAKNSILIGDPSQLENSILNIMLNACDAMDGVGELIIKTDNLIIEESEIEKLELGKAKHFIEIEIQDNGSGISPEILPKIFEPFFTTKGIGKGTGLGLASVYGAIKDHHGAIQVWSEVNIGTKFSILLPVNAPLESMQEVLTLKIESELPFKGVKLALIIDDEFLIRHSLKVLLEDYKIKTLEADNGEAAINSFEMNKDKIDLIVLDLIMPKISGIAVYQHIRKLHSKTPILFISGFKKEVSDLPLDQNSAFLQKPFEEKDFITCIKKLIPNLI